MRLTNVAGFKNIDEYVAYKIKGYEEQEKNFKTLFFYMFSEKENIMAESSDGYRIKKITYGECHNKICEIAPNFEEALSFAPKGSIVGLYMNNSLEWIQTFWALLMVGYRPLLLNARLDWGTLEKTISDHGVAAVVSDGKTFSVKTVLATDIFSMQSTQRTSSCDWGDEVLFMSSGTSTSVKLCAYTGENFFYQICDSANIIQKCPQMKKHYEGELKILTLLPFYHVFGFIAVYLWFGFFSRTFVFLKDLHPQTLLNTVRKHKVTHIFAVPLVWETVYKEAMRKIKARGGKTYKKFQKALTLVSKTQGLGTFLSNIAFKEIRENLFGDSICFLITGGSAISPEALRFFNGIGYHMANGYGMTEVGITSVDIAMKRKKRNLGSVGRPFQCTQYSISSSGELQVKGKTMASRIVCGGEERITNFDEWFNTHDLAQEKANGYYLLGREDDLIVCKNGENLNPEIIEKSLKLKNADGVCLFADEKGEPTLLVSVIGCYSGEKLKAVYAEAVRGLQAAKAQDEVKNILLTTDKLLQDNDFKVSRKKIAKRYAANSFTIVDPNGTEEHAELLLSVLEKEICACFAQALQIDISEVNPSSDFFADLGGSSLDYFALVDLIKDRFGVELAIDEDKKLSSVSDFHQYIKNC